MLLKFLFTPFRLTEKKRESHQLRERQQMREQQLYPLHQIAAAALLSAVKHGHETIKKFVQTG